MKWNVERVVAAELLQGETVLWQGQPNTRKLFARADIYLVPFSVFWCGFAIFWTVTATSGAGLFGIFGIPFVLVGLYFTVGRFYAKVKNKKRTVYAVTNKRALLLSLNGEGEKKTCVAGDIAAMQSESVSIGDDGCGSLYFGTISFYSRMYMNTGLEYLPGYHREDVLAFLDVDDAQRVYEIYKNAKYGLHG